MIRFLHFFALLSLVLFAGCRIGLKEKASVEGEIPCTDCGNTGGGGSGNGGSGGNGGGTTETPQSYFANVVVPAFKAQATSGGSCLNCHDLIANVGVENAATLALYNHASMRPLLVNGASPDFNELMRYADGSLAGHASGIDFCGGDSNNSPCFEIKVWWIKEMNGGTSQPATPFGEVLEINNYCTVSGWALDPNSPNTPINVDFWIDGPEGVGTFVGSAQANQTLVGLPIPGATGYLFTVPAQFRDALPHTVYAYGVDGQVPSQTAALSGSGQSFTCYSPDPTNVGRDFYNNNIRPVLQASSCAQCHGNNFQNYDTVFYEYLTRPTPPQSSPTTNLFITRTRGVNHPVTLCGGSVNGNPCADIQTLWSLEFGP